MGSRDDRWLGPGTGPVVRLGVPPQGRRQQTGESPLDLIDVVAATGAATAGGFRPGPQHRRMLDLCHRPVPVAELASRTNLPTGLVRLLLGDLSEHGLIMVHRPAWQEPTNDELLLRKVLDGLHAL
jgi:uncharacterized protein DUF742